MILEVADIRIAAGKRAEFDAAIKRGVETVIARAGVFAVSKVNRGVRIAPSAICCSSTGQRWRRTPWTSVRVRFPSGVPSLDRSSRSRRWWNTLSW